MFYSLGNITSRNYIRDRIIVYNRSFTFIHEGSALGWVFQPGTSWHALTLGQPFRVKKQTSSAATVARRYANKKRAITFMAKDDYKKGENSCQSAELWDILARERERECEWVRRVMTDTRQSWGRWYFLGQTSVIGCYIHRIWNSPTKQ